MGKRTDSATAQVFDAIVIWQNDADAKIDALIEAVAQLRAHQAGLPLESALAALKNEIARKQRTIKQGLEGHERTDVFDV